MMRAGAHALVVVAAVFGIAASAAAEAIVVDLAVDASTVIRGTVEAFSEKIEDATVTGTLQVRVDVTEDPTHGLVAESVEVLGGTLSIGDLFWELAGTHEALEVMFDHGEASASSAKIPATAVGTNTAELSMENLTIEIDAGTLVAGGTVLDDEILIARDFDAETWPFNLQGVATVVTTPLAAGRVDVSLSIPVAEAAPLRPPLLTSWIEVDGTLVLSATSATTSVPALPHALWLGGFLLAAGYVTARRGLR